MIIHGGYAQILREQSSELPRDIDLMITASEIEHLCSLFSNESYILRRGKTPVASREVILLVPRDKLKPLIKFDCELISHELHHEAMGLPDTQRSVFLGTQIGVVSMATDMIIKEECLSVSRPKHADDVAAYKQLLGNKRLAAYQQFRVMWKKQISDKYGLKDNKL